MKNNAILNAGKTKPTIGTKIEGKNAAVIVIFNKKFKSVLISLKN